MHAHRIHDALLVCAGDASRPDGPGDVDKSGTAPKAGAGAGAVAPGPKDKEKDKEGGGALGAVVDAVVKAKAQPPGGGGVAGGKRIQSDIHSDTSLTIDIFMVGTNCKNCVSKCVSK